MFCKNTEYLEDLYGHNKGMLQFPFQMNYFFQTIFICMYLYCMYKYKFLNHLNTDCFFFFYRNKLVLIGRYTHLEYIDTEIIWYANLKWVGFFFILL